MSTGILSVNISVVQRSEGDKTMSPEYTVYVNGLPYTKTPPRIATPLVNLTVEHARMLGFQVAYILKDPANGQPAQVNFGFITDYRTHLNAAVVHYWAERNDAAANNAMLSGVLTPLSHLFEVQHTSPVVIYEMLRKMALV